MKQRIITGVLAAAVFIPLVFYGGPLFICVSIALAIIGVYELLRMRGIPMFSLPGLLSVGLLVALLVPTFWQVNNKNLMSAFIIYLFLILAYTVFSKNRFSFEDASFITLTVFYVGIGFLFFIQTRMIEDGVAYIFYALFTIWATDSGAYFMGRAFGKRKLWPEISPNKTIEGSIGGTLIAVIVAVLYNQFVGMDMGMVQLIVLTILLSVVGQLGDLVQSAYKRHYGVKDSGRLLPGHGGILDRFDSLLFVLPILHLIIMV
ncbi:MAG: phosphatidate cytidylyltransferase [Bacilli bacterium]